MRIAPAEWIIISVICCIPVAIAAVVGVVFAIVRYAAKEKQNQD